MPSPFYSASVVLFQFHGGMVSHMQALATPSSTVHNTKNLDIYHSVADLGGDLRVPWNPPFCQNA